MKSWLLMWRPSSIRCLYFDGVKYPAPWAFHLGVHRAYCVMGLATTKFARDGSPTFSCPSKERQDSMFSRACSHKLYDGLLPKASQTGCCGQMWLQYFVPLRTVNKAWVLKRRERAPTARQFSSKRKVLPTVFFDPKGMVIEKHTDQTDGIARPSRGMCGIQSFCHTVPTTRLVLHIMFFLPYPHLKKSLLVQIQLLFSPQIHRFPVSWL